MNCVTYIEKSTYNALLTYQKWNSYWIGYFAIYVHKRILFTQETPKCWVRIRHSTVRQYWNKDLLSSANCRIYRLGMEMNIAIYWDLFSTLTRSENVTSLQILFVVSFCKDSRVVKNSFFSLRKYIFPCGQWICKK